MRLQDQITINNMRLEGHTPSVIAATLGIPAGTVRSYIHRNPNIPNTKLCLQCGLPVVQQKNRREKKFCSDTCRMAWWNSHQADVNRKAYYTLVCQHCGKEFESYGNKNQNIAAGPVTFLPDSRDKYAPANLMFYRTSLALYRNMAEEGKISDDTYRKIRTILNKKYGLSSGSIFAETA